MQTTGTERYPYTASAITDQLFIAPRPRTRHLEQFHGLGVDLVLSMIGLRPPRVLAEPPYQLVRLPVFDNPFIPIPLVMLQLGVSAALPVLEGGGRVLVYCRAGRHRSVAMASCILIARGMTADEAMDLIVTRRPYADPHARHIEKRIRAFEQAWLDGWRPTTT